MFATARARRRGASRVRQRPLLQGFEADEGHAGGDVGLEGLDRLVAAEPLWRVHECVYSILALESDPVDPRL